MKNKININNQIRQKPFKDWEQPNVRINIKEDEYITNHLLFCKTHKEKSFSEQTLPKEKLLQALKLIQDLPKLKSSKDKHNTKVFNNFIKILSPLLPHLMLLTNDSSNTVSINNIFNLSLKDFNEVFQIVSKAKSKAMYDKFIAESSS